MIRAILSDGAEHSINELVVMFEPRIAPEYKMRRVIDAGWSSNHDVESLMMIGARCMIVQHLGYFRRAGQVIITKDGRRVISARWKEERSRAEEHNSEIGEG